jgi:phosphatidylserine/phosphatidylglycerophosphate/cardiolipin synthase-like enzyme
MLEWQTFTHGNRQVGFVVDGKLDHVLERTFGEIKGMEVFSDYFDETPQSPDRIIDEAVPEAIRDRVRRTIVSTSEAISMSKASLELATEKENSRVEVIDPDRPDTRKAQADRIRDLENQVSELDNLHGSRPRLIWTADIRDLFHKALDIARERLVIMSAFVSDKVVDAKFENKLELCIQRGTKVYIVVGEMVDKNTFREEARARGLIKLERLAKKYPSQFLLTFEEHHAKILVCDSEYAITGSFNFLSFSGYHKKVRDEGSILLKNPDIEPIFTELMLKYFQ